MEILPSYSLPLKLRYRPKNIHVKWSRNKDMNFSLFTDHCGGHLGFLPEVVDGKIGNMFFFIHNNPMNEKIHVSKF